MEDEAIASLYKTRSLSAQVGKEEVEIMQQAQTSIDKAFKECT